MTATKARGAGRVDPRLAARRASVAKKASAKRLRSVAIVSAIAAIAIIAIALSNSSWLDVDAIEVDGVERADPRQIVNASGIELGSPLIEVDLSRSTEAVRQVPWVADATIDRNLDGTITIVVTERVGVVAVPAGSRFAMVDRTGRQLELVEAQPDDFLPVVGVEASGVPGQLLDETGLAVVSLVEALTPTVRDASSGIVVAEDRLQLELTIALSNSSWLDVDAIEVDGVERADPRQIVNASGIELGSPLIEVDLSRSTEAVRQVPWVADATIDRNLDGTITIAVTERVGVVAVPAGSRFAMVDRTGRQLELVEAQPDDFLPVVGVEASGVPGQLLDDSGLAVVSLVEALTPTVRDASSGIIVAENRLQLELTIGGRADLGDERGLGEKLGALETILARVDLACVAVIDVRVPDAPTVRRTAQGEIDGDQAAVQTESESETGSVPGQQPSDEEPFAGPGGC